MTWPCLPADQLTGNRLCLPVVSAASWGTCPFVLPSNQTKDKEIVVLQLSFFSLPPPPIWVNVVLEPALNSSKAIRPNSSHSTDRLLMSPSERTVRGDRWPLTTHWQRQLLWETSRNLFLLIAKSKLSLNVLCDDTSCMNLWSGMSLVKWFQKVFRIRYAVPSLLCPQRAEGAAFSHCLPESEVLEESVPWEETWQGVWEISAK